MVGATYPAPDTGVSLSVLDLKGAGGGADN